MPSTPCSPSRSRPRPRSASSPPDSTASRAPSGDPLVPRDTSWLAASRTRSAWLFLAPMLVILAAVAGWPLLRTIWLGFTDANTLHLDQAKWVGFDNYLTHQ